MTGEIKPCTQKIAMSKKYADVKNFLFIIQ